MVVQYVIISAAFRLERLRYVAHIRTKAEQHVADHVIARDQDAMRLDLRRQMTVAEARSILREAPGVMLIDKREDEGYMTPVECVGEWATYVSRIREDRTVENGLAMWIVSDNLRKGAALNAVQIAELLLNRGILKAGKALPAS